MAKETPQEKPRGFGKFADLMKSGGPKMRMKKINTDDEDDDGNEIVTVECTWFAGKDGEAFSHEFDERMLNSVAN